MRRVAVPEPAHRLCASLNLSDRNCMRNEQIAPIPRQLAAANRCSGRGAGISGLIWTIQPADGIRAKASQTGRTLMKHFLLKIFTWWSGQTFGTQLWTWRFGELVGQDEQGNTYYRTKGGKIDPTLGFERRWVVYNGYAEATKIPPSWHGWIHHTVDVAPTEENYVAREWEKP